MGIWAVNQQMEAPSLSDSVSAFQIHTYIHACIFKKKTIRYHGRDFCLRDGQGKPPVNSLAWSEEVSDSQCRVVSSHGHIGYGRCMCMCVLIHTLIFL